MRRIASLTTLFALAIVAVPVVVAQAPSAPGAPDKSRVTAGTYAADPAHTMVVWRVDHLGFSNYTGIFGDVTGTLVLDPANPAAAKVDVTIPVSKVTTASAGLTGQLSQSRLNSRDAVSWNPWSSSSVCSSRHSPRLASA